MDMQNHSLHLFLGTHPCNINIRVLEPEHPKDLVSKRLSYKFNSAEIQKHFPELVKSCQYTTGLGP